MSLKILYAANNSYDSKIRLWRFLQNVEGKNYQIKIAAYKKSSPFQIIDWTLDSLLGIFDSSITFDNNNLKIYFEQVKYFNPDLIISDLEPFTSYVATDLNIKLWQVSPLLLAYGLSYADKYRLGLRNRYSHFFKHTTFINKYLINALDNSDKKFVYSHFSDMSNVPILENTYEWVRPYYLTGLDSKPCHHSIVGTSLFPDVNINVFLNRFKDSIMFSQGAGEKYINLVTKDLENELEYICNLRNSDIFVCQGHTSFLADAYYNKKYSLVLPDFRDLECVSNAALGEMMQVSKTLYGNNLPGNFKIENIVANHNTSVKFLHQHIEEI